MTPPLDAALRAVVLLVAALLLVGCGVRAETRPEPVTTPAAPSSNGDNGPPGAGPRLTVFFVRGADLAPVERRTRATTTAAALDQLVEGPTRAEVRAGLRTALPPEVVGVDEVLSDGLTTVSVTRGFTGITGGNQLLAVAQIVWTLTALPTVTTVRFVVEGTPVEVPTDGGLTDRPVGRDDYRSVAPAEPTPTPTPTPPPPPPPEVSTPTGSTTPR
ncbi:GerMN domain-containing protein [Geodermatophilus sp. SYSU D01186]